MAQTTQQAEVVFFTRPSMRRAFFYSFIYACAVLFGRYKTNLDPQLNRYWLGALGILLVLLVLIYIRRLCTSYIITSDEVSVKSGILARKFVVVPHSRITNAYARQSFLERLLGLVNLQIDCAGGDAKELTFQLITSSEAREAAQIIRSIRTQNELKTRPASLEATGT